MMDVLKYRFPGTEKNEKKGVFAATLGDEAVDGFVVYSFDKYKSYLFVEDENETNSQFHYCREVPKELSKDDYFRNATEFRDQIIERGLSKAIFSRVKFVKKSVDAHLFFDALCETYPNAFVYLISSSHFGTWIGATPEPLVEAKNERGYTVALAGTKKSEENNDWGDKEKREQYFVQEFIQERLESINIKTIDVEGPIEHIAGPVKHLKSSFNFVLSGNEPLEVARRLHPTPAVSGLPQRESIALINQIEGKNRSLYTGFLGEVNRTEANLYVNLRCAQIFEDKIALYLGGGFTKDSVVENEWEETENKARTLLKVIENL